MSDYRLCDICGGKAAYDGNDALRDREELEGYALFVAHRRCLDDPETVERVARAIAEAHHETVGTEPWSERLDWKVPILLWRALAVAALDAAREAQ